MLGRPHRAQSSAGVMLMLGIPGQEGWALSGSEATLLLRVSSHGVCQPQLAKKSKS